MNDLRGPSKRHIKIEWDVAETADQLGEDHEVSLHMRKGWSTNRVEYANQISFLIGEAKVAVAKIERLGERDDRRQVDVSSTLRIATLRMSTALLAGFDRDVNKHALATVQEESLRRF
jgi:hypothetical protein